MGWVMIADVMTIEGLVTGWFDDPAEQTQWFALRDAVADYNPDPAFWLAMVLDNPAADWPRVAFAAAVHDDDPDRAEFVRLQILRRPDDWTQDVVHRVQDLLDRNWRRWVPAEAVVPLPESLVWQVWACELVPDWGTVRGRAEDSHLDEVRVGFRR